jgi:hypothetical protein
VGGEPRSINLLVKKGDVPGLKQLGISFSHQDQLSDPVLLLYEGERQYILRLRDGAVVQVNKEIVSAVEI